MTSFICATCGAEYPPSAQPPPSCPICEDPRQFVPPEGQRWTTQDQLRASHRNVLEELEPGIWSLRTEPAFAIGQRAHLIQTPEGNILWDCITLLDDATIEAIRDEGGLAAIAVSHPHYYSAIARWSEAFGNAPVWIHRADEPWIVHRPRNLQLWEGEQATLPGGFLLAHTGGHFDGYQVGVHAGALFAGDQPQVCMDRRWVSFLYSYPNMIPFNAPTIRHIAATLRGLPFGRLYGAFGRNIPHDAKAAIERSAERYLKAIS